MLLMSGKKWRDSFEIYMLALGLPTATTNARKIAILRHCMGKDHIKTFNALVWADGEDKTKYKDVLSRLDRYFEPKKHLEYAGRNFIQGFRTLVKVSMTYY